MGTKGKPVFLREATGLVREFSLLDSTYMGLSVLNVLVGVPAVYLSITFLFPEADFAWAFFVGFLASIAIAAVFGMMGAAMPRAGGDYVWTSRVLWPILGFANNFAFFCLAIATAISYVAYEFSSFFLSMTFQFLGGVTQSAQLLSIGQLMGTPTASFLLGSATLVLMFIVSILGLKVVRWLQAGLATLMIIGTFAVIYLFATTSNSQFIAEFNAFQPMLNSSYEQVISVARQNGWVPTAPTMIGAVLPLVFTLNMYAGFQVQSMVAGEIKHAGRNLPLSVYLALIVGLVMWGGLSVVILTPLGRDFFQAVSYLYFMNPTVYSSTLSVPPVLNLFINVMSADKPGLFWLIFVGFMASFLVFPLAYFQVLARMTFAWSFDRIMPSWFGKVSDRFHVPMNSLVVTLILGEIFLGVYAFGSWALAYINWTLLLGILTIPWGVAALVFPFRKKEIYRNAPTLSRSRFLGVPVVSIAGLIVTLIGIFSVYFDISTPAYSGPVAPVYVVLTLVPYVVAVIIYVGAKYYHKSRGLDLGLAFKEIPPE
jgi:APA family basic amino acid/polyamine antiporter